jgi:hypothetical protein
MTEWYNKITRAWIIVTFHFINGSGEDAHNEKAS